MPPHYVRTYGLAHISLSSANPSRSADFYTAVLSNHTVDHDDRYVRIETPGALDVIVFERSTGPMGRLGDMAHFGFRLASPDDIATAANAVTAGGGEVVEQGELVDGEPYLFARDIDGYLFEVWYSHP